MGCFGSIIMCMTNLYTQYITSCNDFIAYPGFIQSLLKILIPTSANQKYETVPELGFNLENN
jgi:hypothetical protein